MVVATGNRRDRCPCGQRRPVGVLLGMRSGARPRWEGQWYCRKTCLQAALLDRVHRDFPDREARESRLRHRIPLGLLLQARGLIQAEELKRALDLQRSTGRRLGRVLTENFGIAEDGITRAIAAQWGLPVVHVPKLLSMRLLYLAPSQFFGSAGCVPLELKQGQLLLGSAEGLDSSIALALERMHGFRVNVGSVAASALERWRVAPPKCLVRCQSEVCIDRNAMAITASDLLLRLQPVESRVVRVGQVWWLRLWLEQAAVVAGEANADTLDVLLTCSDASAESEKRRHSR